MSRRFLILALPVAVAAAQQFQSNSVHVGDGEVSATYGPPRATAVVTGAPYSAERLQEYTPSPGEARAPSSSVIGRFARDSYGRTRSSIAYKAAPYWLTEIVDPVAGVAFLLDDQQKVAHRMALATPAAIPPMPARFTSQTLGTQTIDGVTAEGTRISGPLMIDTWKSPELKIDLAVRSSNGYSSRMINLSRNEPDPAFFRPPADYRVVDETEPFRMTIRTR